MSKMFAVTVDAKDTIENIIRVIDRTSKDYEDTCLLLFKKSARCAINKLINTIVSNYYHYCGPVIIAYEETYTNKFVYVKHLVATNWYRDFYVSKDMSEVYSDGSTVFKLETANMDVKVHKNARELMDISKISKIVNYFKFTAMMYFRSKGVPAKNTIVEFPTAAYTFQAVYEGSLNFTVMRIDATGNVWVAPEIKESYETYKLLRCGFDDILENRYGVETVDEMRYLTDLLIDKNIDLHDDVEWADKYVPKALGYYRAKKKFEEIEKEHEEKHTPAKKAEPKPEPKRAPDIYKNYASVVTIGKAYRGALYDANPFEDIDLIDECTGVPNIFRGTKL